MIRFELHRDDDVTGVSGDGIVADGIRLPDGRAVLRWRGPRSSTVLWRSMEHAVAVHGHDGATRVVDAGEVPADRQSAILAAVDTAQRALDECLDIPDDPPPYDNGGYLPPAVGVYVSPGPVEPPIALRRAEYAALLAHANRTRLQ